MDNADNNSYPTLDQITMTRGRVPENTAKHAIQVQDLGVVLTDTVILDSLSLEISQGQWVAIVGPSGCGKSTLLRTIAGLTSPSTGVITWGQPSAPRPPLAFVFQDSTLLPWRTVYDNIRLPLELSDGRHSAQQTTVKEKVKEKIQLVGLSQHDMNKFPRMLSGGMKMRVSLARALITNPAVLLLDEPFAALDEILRQQLNEDLLRIWATSRTTTVMVTHNVAEAIFLAERILVMGGQGQLLADVTVPFTYPRQRALRTTLQFAKVNQQISEILFAQSRTDTGK